MGVVTAILVVSVLWLLFKVYRQDSFIESLTEKFQDLKAELAELKKSSRTPPQESGSSVAQAKAAPVPEMRPVYDAAQPPKIPPSPMPRYAPLAEALKKPAVAPRSKERIEERKSKIIDWSINWENFLGAKMFAWIGGLSLFIGFAFLLKYSFDHDLISPVVRVAIGFFCGAGLIAGGTHLRRKTYLVTAQTLCATGIVILYASSFAANVVYQFFGSVFTFILMSLITAGAFVLAAGTSAMVIAILGLVGGFLTPVLLSTGQDQPLALFGYITFLNLGLFCVAHFRKWHFLAALGAIGTILMQIGWSVKFFHPEKVFTAMAIYLWFDVLFFGAFRYGKKAGSSDRWLVGSAVSLPFVTFVFTLFLCSYPSLGTRPGVLFTFLLGADLCLLAAMFLESRLRKIHPVAGGSVFLVLGVWIFGHLTSGLLIWALGGSLVFAVLHSIVPVLMARRASGIRVSGQVYLFPLLALFMTLIPILKDTGGDWILWPFVLLLNGIILGLALVASSAFAVLSAVVITALLILGWIFSTPAGALELGEPIAVIGVFGIFFSVVATFVLGRMRRRLTEAANGKPAGALNLLDLGNPDNLFVQIPVFSSALPFILLILVSSRMNLANPSPVLVFGLFLVILAIGLVRYLKEPLLLPFAMACSVLLEAVMYLQHFNSEYAPVFLGFCIVYMAVFLSMPFLFKQDYRETAVPWSNAAMSGPLHFFLVFSIVRDVYPNGIMGLLPAVMAIPFFLGLIYLTKWMPEGSPKRTAVLAWFGGSTLFFVTLIFPIQFSHEWLTISWALEGAALIWLFQKIPHSGLRGVGAALLAIAFIRLAMNPAVLGYHPRSSMPVFNWHLYTYGTVILCLMFGGRLLAPPQNRMMRVNVPPILFSWGTILMFLLVNIEIADMFSTGETLTFQFTGDLARGMSYSIAWSLFALGLLIVGIWKEHRAFRFAAIGLIGVTLAKLFFFDLSRLDQLYRIGAFIGVAVVLIVASVLYQKWIVHEPGKP